jgi:hypothetical protein
MRSPILRTLRLIVVTVSAMLFVLFVPLSLMGLGTDVPALIWLVLPTAVGTGMSVLLPSISATLRPMPLTTTEAEARATSVGVLRTQVMVRMALAESPALFGFVASIAGESIVPYLIGFGFSLPLLAVFAYPRDAVVDAVRTRLEANGATSWLWESII